MTRCATSGCQRKPDRDWNLCRSCLRDLLDRIWSVYRRAA